MKMLLALSPLFAGCTLELEVGTMDPDHGLTEVAQIPATINNNLDLLFVIDDSPGGTELQTALHAAFPAFVQALASAPGGPSNLHLGVVSSDVGSYGASDAYPGPGIGSGPGSCSSYGKNGILHSTAGITDNFIVDVDGMNGTRSTNYTTTLADAFASISSLGSTGCGFEQPLQAATRVFSRPENAGFHRPAANLAVVVVATEDDCSMARSALMGSDTATFGPLQSFRCTRFGVTCEQGGATSDDMNEVGAKGNCRASTSQYLMDLDATAAYLQSLKPDPRMVMFGAIAGTASPIEVELRVPAGGGTPIPALKHACTWSPPDNPAVAVDPSIRIDDFATRFPRHYLGSACKDMTSVMLGLARELRGQLGDTCLTRDIATPVECEAWDVTPAFRTPLPLCTSAPANTACYQLVSDPISCMGQGLRVEITRTVAPPPNNVVSVRCKV
jgi:hypothetical protein